MPKYILILHIWNAYYAYIMPAGDINDDDSISRGTNQESHPSHNPSIANSEELPQKENSFEREEWKKKRFNKQFDLKILSLSKIFCKSRIVFFWQIILKLIQNRYFVKQGIFGDTVFDLLEVELVLWFHYLYSLWELGHGWKRWGGQTERSLSQLTSSDVEDKDTLLFLLISRNLSF